MSFVVGGVNGKNKERGGIKETSGKVVNRTMSRQTSRQIEVPVSRTPEAKHVMSQGSRAPSGVVSLTRFIFRRVTYLPVNFPTGKSTPDVEKASDVI